MVENVEQHQAFQKGLEAMTEYSNQVEKDASIYDGEKLVTMIETFGDAFCLHLHDEIPTLAPEKLLAIFPDPKDLKTVIKDMVQYTIAHATKITALPWVIPNE